MKRGRKRECEQEGLLAMGTPARRHGGACPTVAGFGGSAVNDRVLAAGCASPIRRPYRKTRCSNLSRIPVALCAGGPRFLGLRRALFLPALNTLDHRRRAAAATNAALATGALMSAVSSTNQRCASAPRPFAHVIG